MGVIIFSGYSDVSYIESEDTSMEVLYTGDYDIYLMNDEGKLLVKYTGGRDYGVIVVDKDMYRNFYIIDRDGEEIVPLVYGDGNYKINICEYNGTKNLMVIDIIDLDIGIGDKLSIFKGLGYYIDINDKVVEISNKLWDGDKKRFIDSVYRYVLGYSYNNGLADKVLGKEILVYKPNIENIIANKSGICIDKASLMASILRVKEIPTRILVGHLDNGDYHAWVEVYYNNNWLSYDPTLGYTYRDNVYNKYKIEKIY